MDYCSETESLFDYMDYGTFGVDQAVRRQSSEVADDDDLPFAVSFALVVVGMWKSSPHRELTSPEDDHRKCDKEDDIGGVELSDINGTISTKIDEDDMSDTDFIALKFEPSSKKKNCKREFGAFCL